MEIGFGVVGVEDDDTGSAIETDVPASTTAVDDAVVGGVDGTLEEDAIFAGGSTETGAMG